MRRFFDTNALGLDINADKIFAELDDWLGDHHKGLYGEVEDLLIARHIFQEVYGLVDANPEVRDTPSSFWSWMDALYPTWASMVVRRLSDDSKDSRSFLRFLRQIHRHPEVLSRQRFVNLYRPDPPGFPVGEAERSGNKDFDCYAGSGQSHLPRSAIEDDMARLQKTTSTVQIFATKRIAHIDEVSPHCPTFGELDECIDLFEKLLRRYVMLFRAIDGAILPTWTYDWRKIFRKPWLRS